MKLPEFGVKRPVAAGMLFLAIIMVGLVALKLLPLDIMPDMELPSVTVITAYPGASANEVEEQVTKPLETILSSAEHLNEIKSTSKENVSFIQLNYKWGTDVTSAANNARDLIELVRRRLPDGARQPVIYKVNSSMMPIVAYSINAKSSYDGIEQIVEDEIAAPLRKVEGVGTVVYLGQPEREIHVNIDPRKLDAYHLSVAQISTILKAENIAIPGGNIRVGVYDFSVRVPGKFKTVSDVGNTVLTVFGGNIIRLRDVADISDTFAEKDAHARNSVGEGIALMVQKQSGTNTLEVVKAVREKMNTLKKNLPKDVQVFEMISTDEVITQSINNLTSSLWYALLFVTLVVFAFLREWRSSLIIFVTMPVSLISAFIVMYAMNYTINIFSLMSLVIAIGMVVDNAIVVLENITKHVERGDRPRQAAIFGASEMGLAIAASTATTLVVFLPMLFMGGIVGIMFKQLAILTSVCLIMSLFTALTLTPMLSSRLIKPASAQKKHNKFYVISERLFDRVENAYKIVLGWAVFHKGFTIAIAVVILVLTGFWARTIGTDYIPNFDAGDLAVVIETETGTGAAETDSIARRVLQIMQENVPEMVPGTAGAISGQTKDGLLTTVGFKEGKNVASVLCHLTLPDKRERTAQEIGDALRAKIEQIPEIERFKIAAGSMLFAAVTGSKRPIEVIVSGKEFSQINAVAEQIKNRLSGRNGFTDVSSSVDDGKLEVEVEIDKQKASRMGLNTALIAMQLRQSLYGAESGAYTEEGDDYNIIVRYAPEFRNEIKQIGDMRITNLLGQQIPLSAVADIREGIGPMQIRHIAQQRYVVVGTDLDGISLGKATKEVRQILDKMNIPEGVDVEIGGQVSDQSNSFGDLYLILFLGIMLVYMVMAAQFESFKDPFIIIFAIPFTLVGVIWAFKLTGLTLSITTFIGVIMLMGIVVNNGIILVDYTNMLRKRDYSLRDAVMEAGRSRLRPVLMTTLTTVLGMLPMAMSTGMGKEMYSPLGITIIGGLLISTLVTLILIPTIYTALNNRTLVRDRRAVRRREGKDSPKQATI